MAGLSILKRLLMKQAMKESAPFQHEGIMSISKSLAGNVDTKIKRMVESAKRQGVDLDNLSEQELKYMLEMNKPKGPTIGGHRIIDASFSEGQGITRDLFNILDRQSGKNVIKADFGKPFAEETGSVNSIIKNIKTMEPMDAMKEANKILKGDGRYKSLSKTDRKKIVDDESVTDHIFERNIEPDPEDFAYGGVAGMLGEPTYQDEEHRVPYKDGKTGFSGTVGEWLKENPSRKELLSGSPSENIGDYIKPMPQYDERGNLIPIFSKTGKQQIEGAPEGITSDKEVFNLIIGLDIPITEKINILGDIGFSKFRDRIEKDDQELFLVDPASNVNKNIGIGYEDDGLSGSIMYNPDTKYKQFQISKKFADGGVAGLLGERIGFRGGGADAGGKSSPGGGTFGGDGNGGNARENYRTQQYTTPKTKTTPSGGGGGKPKTNTGITSNYMNPTFRKATINFLNRKQPPKSFIDNLKNIYGEDVTPTKTYSTEDIEKLLGIKDKKTAEQFVDDPFTSSPRFIGDKSQANVMEKFRENLLEQETKFPSKPFDAQRSGALSFGISPTNQSLVPSDFLDKPGEAATQKPFENIAKDIVKTYDLADGGRARFADGKGPKMSRRNFLKIMGGLATLPVVGKLFKFAKPAAKAAKVADLTSVPIGNAAGMPAWFKPLVNKVIKEGDDVTKKFATKDREIVHVKKLDDGDDVYLHQDLDTGSIRVEYQGKGSFGEGPIQLEYKPGEVIPTKKGSFKEKDSFTASEDDFYPQATSPDGDFDLEFTENIVNKVDDLYSDTSKLKEFATGKKLTIKEISESMKKRNYIKEVDKNPNDHAFKNAPEYDGPYEEDFASGGRVPRSGGGIMKLLKLLKSKPKKLETVKDFISKRQFLKNMVGNTEKNKKARELRMLKEAMEKARKNPGFKFPSNEQIKIDLEKRIQPILNKGRKLNASGGLANMLGE